MQLSAMVKSLFHQWLLCALVCSLCFRRVCSFNLDVSHPVIYQAVSTDPAGENSRSATLFGYSVALTVSKRTGEPFVLVGAPKANSTLGLSAYRNIHEPGVLYKCSIVRGGSCEEVLVDRLGNEVTTDASYRDMKDEGWLGGSLDAEVDGEGRISVCSHRWRNQIFRGYLFGNGMCYLSKNDILDGRMTKIPALISKSEQFYLHEEIRAYMFSYGEMGISTHFSENGEDLLMGAPGVYNWAGTVVKYHEPKLSRNSTSSSFSFPRPPKITVPFPTASPGVVQRYDYFGYSVSSGIFFRGSKVSALIGAPRAEGGKGKVLLLDVPPNDRSQYSVHAERVGATLGEYFGAAVLAVDLNGDGLCEIVVGAPLYSPGGGRTDVGRVYVFMNEGDGVFKAIGRPLTGSGLDKARFGSALSRLYDLDMDGFEDMAVGAPYDDEGRGVVYIYRGSIGDLDLVPSQVITARSLFASLRGFGVSISRGVDIDGNKHPDVVIGSYSSGDAVLLRTKPVIKYKTSLRAKPSKLDTERKKFQVEACIAYEGQLAPDDLTVNISIQIASYHTNSRFDIDGTLAKGANAVANLSRGIDACNSFNIVISQSELVDYSKPIQILMNYEVLIADELSTENQTTFIEVSTRKKLSDESNIRVRRQAISSNSENLIDNFCSSCPIINSKLKGQKFRILNIPFTVGCGADSVCQTDLRLYYSLPGLKNNTFIVGSRPEVNVDLTVVNLLEPASLPRLQVAIPLFISLVRIPSSCHESVLAEYNSLICSIRPHPFGNSSSFSLKLTMDMRNVPATEHHVGLNMTVTSSSEQVMPAKNTANLSIALVREADIEIRGRSHREFIAFRKKQHRNETEKTEYVQHTYDVLKYLVSPVKTVNISFFVPTHVRTGSGEMTNIISLYPPAAYINSQPFQCISQGVEYAAVKPLVSADGGFKLSSISPAPISDEKSLEENSNGYALASTLFHPSINTTLTLDCHSPGRVYCVRISCSSVSFLGESDQATIILGMRLNLTALRPFLHRIDRVSLITEGTAEIVDDIIFSADVNRRPDTASVITDLVTASPEAGSISIWIYIGAAVGALFLLAVITFCLYMGGFFERKHRDKMTKEQEGLSN